MRLAAAIVHDLATNKVLFTLLQGKASASKCACRCPSMWCWLRAKCIDYAVDMFGSMLWHWCWCANYVCERKYLRKSCGLTFN